MNGGDAEKNICGEKPGESKGKTVYLPVAERYWRTKNGKWQHSLFVYKVTDLLK